MSGLPISLSTTLSRLASEHVTGLTPLYEFGTGRSARNAHINAEDLNSEISLSMAKCEAPEIGIEISWLLSGRE